jgi:hypothetical protein
MEIEQLPPNQPKFGLVVMLAGITLLAVLALSLLFVRVDGGHLTFRHHHEHPTSQLVMPHAPGAGYLEPASLT